MKLKSESPMQYRKYRLIAAVVLLSAGFAGKTLAAAPDPDFGVNGTVITSFIGPGAPNNIEAVALQPDGRIVVGGTALARFMADGALDTTFGQAGSVDVPYRIRGIAVQSDGRIVIVGETKEVSGAANLVVARFEADGTDDGAFGDQGRTVVDISGGRDQMNAIAVADDGDIVVAGCSTPGFTQDTAILRFDSSGGLDTSFANGGILEIDLAKPGFDDCPNALLIDPDGKILVGGSAEFDRDEENCDGEDFLLYRVSENGVPDAGFGTGGSVVLEAACPQGIEALFRYPDGRILAAGQGEVDEDDDGFPDDFGDSNWLLARYLADGSPDPAFGAGTGTISANLGDDEEVAGIAVQADGRIVGLGEINSAAPSPDPMLARFTSDGMLDSTFGTGGVATLPSPATQERIQAGVMTPDEGFLLAGFRITPQVGTDAFLARFQEDGDVALDFGDQGVVEADLPEVLNAVANAVVLQPDGKAIAVGTVGGDVGLVRYLADGSVDPAFGDAGMVRHDIAGGSDDAVAATLQADGKLVVAVTNSLAGDDRIAVLRYGPDGVLDATFDGDGLALVPTSGEMVTTSVLVQPDGAIVVAGFDPLGDDDFLAVRLAADGSLDLTFGTAGVATVDFDGANDLVNKVLLQADGKLVLLGQSRTGSNIDFALARLEANGALDSSFGTGGRTTTDFFFASNVISDGVIAPDGSIIGVGFVQNGSIVNRDFAFVTYDASGALAMSGSSTFVDLGAGDEAAALARDAAGRLVAVGKSALDTGLTRVDAMLVPDATFGNGGTIVTDVGNGQSEASDVAIDDEGRIVVVGNTLLADDTSFARAFFTLRFLPEVVTDEGLIFASSFEAGEGGPN